MNTVAYCTSYCHQYKHCLSHLCLDWHLSLQALGCFVTDADGAAYEGNLNHEQEPMHIPSFCMYHLTTQRLGRSDPLRPNSLHDAIHAAQPVSNLTNRQADVTGCVSSGKYICGKLGQLQHTSNWGRAQAAFCSCTPIRTFLCPAVWPSTLYPTQLQQRSGGHHSASLGGNAMVVDSPAVLQQPELCEFHQNRDVSASFTTVWAMYMLCWLLNNSWVWQAGPSLLLSGLPEVQHT